MSLPILRQGRRWKIPTFLAAFALAVGLSFALADGQGGAGAARAATASASLALSTGGVAPVLSRSGVASGVNLLALSGANTLITSAASAPASLLTSSVSSSGTVTATRPVYPYPQIAVDTTGGPVTEASSYTPQVSSAEQNLNVSWLGSFRSGYETVSGWVNGQWVTRPGKS